MSDDQETSPVIARFAERLRRARHVAVLTGAGVSAESGLPTFRDPLTGLWALYRPEDLATPEAFARDPVRRQAARAAMPNPGHLVIARVESLVPQVTLITQNVDGLHRRAGSSDPVELHGNLFSSRCTREGTMHPLPRSVEASSHAPLPGAPGRRHTPPPRFATT